MQVMLGCDVHYLTIAHTALPDVRHSPQLEVRWRQMTGFTQENVDEITEHCRENLELIAESVQLCFDDGHEISIGDCVDWNDGETDYLAGPGLMASFTVGEHGVVMIMPKSLPLPDWYTSADESQEARLQTLAMEWSLNLFPEAFECGEFEVIRSDNVAASLVDMEPLDWGKRLTLPVTNADGVKSEMYLYWPLAKPISNAASGIDDLTAELAAHENESSASDGFGMDMNFDGMGEFGGAADDNTGQSITRKANLAGHLGKFKVTVSVRLAEKRMTMESLLGLMPGSLITFEKPCEDMLDLYVNNLRYCKGEAVKIDEQFGMKVNEVGTRDEKIERVINV